MNIKSGELFIHTSDIVVPQKIDLEKLIQNEDAVTYTFTNNDSYSYCNFKDNNNKLIGMVEKEVVSNKANIGLYGFRSMNYF